MREIKLFELVPKGKKILGDDIYIDGLNLVNRPSMFNSILSYVESEKYIESVKQNSNIKALILRENMLDLYRDISREITYIICDTPESTFYSIHKFLVTMTNFYDYFNFASHIGENCFIADSAIVEKGVIIGNSVNIGAGSIIRKGSIIEDNVTIGCNSIIGSEGFQAIKIDDNRENIPHTGGVTVGRNTYIGDNSTVCKSLFESNTHIGNFVLIDNLVHIGHNCIISDNVVLTAGVVLCGSSSIRKNAWIGTNSTVLNNVVIAENTYVGVGSVVIKNTDEFDKVFGNPARKTL